MIYIVEDDRNIRELIVYMLKQSGFEAQGFEDARAFRDGLWERMPELCVLDIMMPGEDGISLLKFLRESQKTREMPVIMLTARAEEQDKVEGLNLGADDYITKPFGAMEFISRVRAVLRRTGVKQSPGTLQAGCVALNVGKHAVTVKGKEVTLTLKEFEMLRVMMENPGKVYDREQLLKEVWDENYFGGTRTIDVHIQTLRQKLEEGGSIVETVRGLGYRVNGERQEGRIR